MKIKYALMIVAVILLPLVVLVFDIINLTKYFQNFKINMEIWYSFIPFYGSLLGIFLTIFYFEHRINDLNKKTKSLTEDYENQKQNLESSFKKMKIELTDNVEESRKIFEDQVIHGKKLIEELQHLRDDIINERKEFEFAINYYPKENDADSIEEEILEDPEINEEDFDGSL